MNDQIRELAGRALDKSVPYTWTKLDYNQIQELLSCYAELIVAECLDIVEDEDDGSADTKAIRWAMIRIKKHFGVEE